MIKRKIREWLGIDWLGDFTYESLSNHDKKIIELNKRVEELEKLTNCLMDGSIIWSILDMIEALADHLKIEVDMTSDIIRFKKTKKAKERKK